MVRKRKLEKGHSALGSWDERPVRKRGTSMVRKTSRTSRSDIHSILNCCLLFLHTLSTHIHHAQSLCRQAGSRLYRHGGHGWQAQG